MKITIVYGTERKGATYNIAQEVVKNIENSVVTEVFLPRDLPEYCISCFRCFTEEQGTCAHSRYTNQIREKLLWADLIILTSPVYSFHVSGQMKVFLDHFANMYIVHRPNKEMFHKQGLVIATASGPVYSKTLNEMKDSLDLWGVAKTYKLGFALMEVNWDKISEKIKKKITKKAKATAVKIKTNNGNIKPCFRVRKWFYVSRFMHKKLKLNPPDVLYWEEKGWTGKVRPWHK
ncbi:NAD(P)H-dependent oxidoreductase [Ruminiclostridium herbifermentans]|uniref:NAD(P)H-dependent oxidoreductase n=1 Tax=Ruminiclostridium herbifermentans TaxID=2488810 RepID=A0A7H1VPT0_9FIRM|nr:NAD(P)H-dependent oxidoreductase [Ruminiclostridium herbifermentans]QNU67392.1 NAD(P)H-dependent oxidoreductase [Ruminiclostridium herbifermentans]